MLSLVVFPSHLAGHFIFLFNILEAEFTMAPAVVSNVDLASSPTDTIKRVVDVHDTKREASKHGGEDPSSTHDGVTDGTSKLL